MSLAAILLLYLAIGVAAAVGTVTITRRWLSPRAEHVFFAWLLVPIAAMYLAFVDFFEKPGSFPLEAWAAVGFAASGVLGIRFPLLVVAGYALHGAWDLAHEIVPGQTLTPIPLAYGVFCAAYDGCIAGYVLRREVISRHAGP